MLDWKLQVNVSKTKIVVFRNGNKIKETEQWFYIGTLIDIVDDFNYLGVSFRCNGKFHITQKTIVVQAQRAVLGLKRSVLNFYLNKQTELSLSDTYIQPILNYGCETWGFHKGYDIEKVHIKVSLGVHKKAINLCVYNEVGRIPLQYKRTMIILK